MSVSIEDNLGDKRIERPFKYSMTSYGADYVVDLLVKRLNEGDIFIPKFQRQFVWNLKQSSRFIESLLLGLPVPGIFLSKEYATEKLLVVDGQQRLKTLQYFYNGIYHNGREFKLRYVQPEYEGLTYKSLKDSDRRRLDNAIMHATIVKQDQPVEKISSSVFYLFERLNTGGTQLVPQEIRACVYHGPFNDLLAELNENIHWRSIFGKISRRLRDQELLLRFFALYFNSTNYSEPMRGFLNDYMAVNKNPKRKKLAEFRNLFTNSIAIIYDSIGDDAFRPVRALNAAVCESVLIGVTRRLKKGKINDLKGLKNRYLSLIKDEAYIDAIFTRTGLPLRVENRLDLATKIFDDLQ